MSHNNQNTPSAKDILDHIRNKSNPDTRATMHSKLKKMLQQSKNGSVQVQTPIGNVTIKEHIRSEPVPEREDESQLELTVREALQKAFSLYYSTEDEGSEIYSAIAENEPVEITDDIKAQADACIKSFAESLFEKKLLDAESLSDWENALAKFLAVPDRKMQKRWLALCTSLPRFHNTNITKKRLSELKESVPNDFHINFDTVDKDNKPVIAKLRFLEKFVDRNSKRSNINYIFTQNYSPKHCSIMEYSVDTKDIDKISMLDFIVDHNELIECKIQGNSRSFIGNFNSLRIDNIKFL